MATRKELIEAVGARYRASPIGERSAILDEFVAITGYHRKHAIRVLAKPAEQLEKRRPSVRYGPTVSEALHVPWEVSDRVCSKRLKVRIPALLPALLRHGKLEGDAVLQAQLAAVSAATIDRLLAPIRLASAKGRRRAAGQSSAVRRAVPIRTFGDWDDPAPGYVEVDFVAHSGPQLSGSFIQTLVLTDIATGWTECLPVLTRDGTLVIDAIAKARELFPFPLLGVDFDNDSAFMNERVVKWCRERGLEVTRARSYRKNDQAWVEQDQAICESVSFFSGEQERARNLLLGILGHDMRNPLNAIQLTAHHLNNLNAGEAVSSAAAVLIRSGARMRALLDDLTDYNRKRLGVGLHIIPSEVDLRHILEDEVQQLRSAHPDRQIISNLVVNALKYGTPGSTLRVTAKGLDDQVVFTVENRGEPITPSALANLFDPLRRGTDRLLPEEGSLGLGLSSAARLPRPTAARSKPRRPMARRRSPCAYRGPAPPKTGLLTRQFDAAQTHRAAQRAAVGLGCAAPTDGCDLYDGGR